MQISVIQSRPVSPLARFSVNPGIGSLTRELRRDALRSGTMKNIAYAITFHMADARRAVPVEGRQK